MASFWGPAPNPMAIQELKDATDRTALDLAEDQRKRGKDGAVPTSVVTGEGHPFSDHWRIPCYRNFESLWDLQ